MPSVISNETASVDLTGTFIDDEAEEDLAIARVGSIGLEQDHRRVGAPERGGPARWLPAAVTMTEAWVGILGICDSVSDIVERRRRRMWGTQERLE